MQYHHRFRVQAPLAEVVNFHRQSASMGAITPPPVIVRIQRAPAILQDGDEMAFTLWLGPLPIHWVARIEAVTPAGFADRQLSGPFQVWVHQHSFQPLGEQVTEVIDDLEITLADSWHWKLMGLGMVFSLPLLFAYRGWKTKTILEKSQSQANASQQTP